MWVSRLGVEVQSHRQAYICGVVGPRMYSSIRWKLPYFNNGGVVLRHLTTPPKKQIMATNDMLLLCATAVIAWQLDVTALYVWVLLLRVKYRHQLEGITVDFIVDLPYIIILTVVLLLGWWCELAWMVLWAYGNLYLAYAGWVRWLEFIDGSWFVPVSVETLVGDTADLIDHTEPEMEDDEAFNDLFGNVFDESPSEYDVVARRHNRNRNRLRMTVRARNAMYVKHRRPVDSPANRLMVEDSLSKWLVSEGVRPSHITQILPVALELVFTPTEADVIAAQIRSSRTVCMRKRMVTGWDKIPGSAVEHIKHYTGFDLDLTRFRHRAGPYKGD